ncbi:MAG: haloacid dehalogenase-like hydrolase, partial [Kofleriaceae bacterium]
MQTIESRRDEPALFVDLDGTLIKTDIVLESLLVLIKARPWVVFLLPLWLLRGRAQLKAEIARRIDLSADGLIFDERLVERLRIEHGDGRQVVLVTTSSRKCADAVADHLGVFSHVIASSETAHLNREAK